MVMKVIAFVGESGTGKSYRAISVAKCEGVDTIIDDGLLISGGKVIAGTSAKKELTKIASVKHALFMRDEYADEIKMAIEKREPKCLMILGTSDAMVQKIAARLEVGNIEKTVRIEDVATPNEIARAKKMRMSQGKHVIPVPTLEIKQQFSGYFLHPLRIFQKNMDTEIDGTIADKSIVRPTYSYLGEYTISDAVIIDMAEHQALGVKGVFRTNGVNIRQTAHGIHIDMSVTLYYGYNIYSVCKKVQLAIKNPIEEFTSINVRRVHIYVKSLYTK